MAVANNRRCASCCAWSSRLRLGRGLGGWMMLGRMGRSSCPSTVGGAGWTPDEPGARIRPFGAPRNRSGIQMVSPASGGRSLVRGVQDLEQRHEFYTTSPGGSLGQCLLRQLPRNPKTGNFGLQDCLVTGCYQSSEWRDCLRALPRVEPIEPSSLPPRTDLGDGRVVAVLLPRTGLGSVEPSGTEGRAVGRRRPIGVSGVPRATLRADLGNVGGTPDTPSHAGDFAPVDRPWERGDLQNGWGAGRCLPVASIV